MKKIGLLLFSCLVFLWLAAQRRTDKLEFNPSDPLNIEETFLSLDSVWTPGQPQIYSLHPFDNYLWIKDGMLTFLVDEVRGKSFRGLVNDVKVEYNLQGKTTFMTVRNAKMKLEIRELGNNRFEIFTYNYLENYERMFSSYWVDVSKIQFTEEE